MMGEIKRYKWTREQMEPLSYGSYVNYVDHAAAIRRAKAEGLREAVILARTFWQGQYDACANILAALQRGRT